MTERTYLDFDVLLEPASPGSYRARVLNSPVGETRPVPVTIPFSDLEVENFLLRIGRPRRHLVRSEGAPEATAVRDFGARLFEAVFHDQVHSALTASLDQAEGRDAGLRVRLRLTDSPELADLPWEYLYDGDARRFLALSEWTPVVRYLDLPGRIRPLPVQPPLRVLVLVASPTDFPPLDVEAEWGRLEEALGELQRAGRVVLERVPSGTLGLLQRQLRRGQHHVFHYIGHGRYDAELGDGQLAMEGPTGRAQPISGSDLGALLHDHRTLRLALLNSCEGARGGRTDPYSGTAQSLVHQGIPAVVAMQFEITDRAAIVFTRGFYEAVADGYPLDAAIAEARKAIRLQPNEVEWGTPVLYLRAPDGRVFDVADPPDTAGSAPVTGDVPVAPGTAHQPVLGDPSGAGPDVGLPPHAVRPPVPARAEPGSPAAPGPPAHVGGDPPSGTQHDRSDDEAPPPARRPGERRRPGDGAPSRHSAAATTPQPGRPRKTAAPRTRAQGRPAGGEGAGGAAPAAPRTSTRHKPAGTTRAAPPGVPAAGTGAAASGQGSSSASPPSPPLLPPTGATPPTPARRPSRRFLLVVAAVVLLVGLVASAVLWVTDRQQPGGPDDRPAPVASDSETPGPAEPTSPGPPPVSPSVPIPAVGPAIPVGETPGYVVATPSGRQLYVANRGARVITVVDVGLNQVTGHFDVPVGPPQFVAFSPDGRTAYLSLYDPETDVGAFGVLDTRTREIVKTVPLDGKPWSPAVTRDGERVYLPVEDPNAVAVIDTRTYEVLTEIPAAPLPHSIEFTPDGARGYLADHTSDVVSVIDTTTDTVLQEVPVDAGPHRVAVHPDRPLVANVNYEASTVTVIDTNSNTVTTSIPVGDGPQDITWSADGHFAYVTNVDAHTLSVIAADDWSVTTTLPMGKTPTSVAVLPDGSRGYVTNLDDGTLTVLHLGG
ncbi:CHAT domain-containing protein [Geodermatophilus maliterrae]|uniref:CHAT domain-containing protein n=1 Tax=Geodermatophilus maliterrae TaxID=3162531 RepID=A0ABV3XI98_9ACTN